MAGGRLASDRKLGFGFTASKFEENYGLGFRGSAFTASKFWGLGVLGQHPLNFGV